MAVSNSSVFRAFLPATLFRRTQVGVLSPFGRAASHARKLRECVISDPFQMRIQCDCDLPERASFSNLRQITRRFSGCRGEVAQINVASNLGAHIGLRKAERGALGRDVFDRTFVNAHVPNAMFPGLNDDLFAHTGVLRDRVHSLIGIFDIEIERSPNRP